MKRQANNNKYQLTDLSKLSNEELAEAFVFPSDQPVSAKGRKEEEEFWNERRKQLANRSPQQRIYGNLLQLKFQLEDHVNNDQYQPTFNFGYFLNEYISRQERSDKEFAADIDIKPAVLSQYLNDHRKPTEKFIIRLELHSNGLIEALTWLKLLQKDKEHQIMSDIVIRKEESKHVKKRLEFAF